MSEPLSSTEIEDVLSSIRRLVSDDLRPLPRNPAPAVAEKLILTPALRVVQPDVPPVAAPAPAPYRLHLGLPAHATIPGLDQVVAKVGAAVDAQSLEWEAETGDTAPVAAAAPGADDWQDTMPDAPYFDDTLSMSEDVIHFLEGTATGDDMHTKPPTAVTEMPGWAQLDAEPTGDLTPDFVDAPSLAHGTIEPDPAWADAAEASVIASLAADINEDPDAPPAQLENEPMLFDEEVLRELVRDILREELAGRMGERITSNIRKLVRAEIARSFATQAFE